MPRLNDVFMVGLVANLPSGKYDGAGKLVQLALPVFVVHGKRDYGERQVTDSKSHKTTTQKGSSLIWVLSNNEDFINEMKDCKPFDIVEIKGVIRVVPTKKKCMCPECENTHYYQSTKTTVYPLYFSIRKSYAEKYGIESFAVGHISESLLKKVEDEAWTEVERCLEISNGIQLIGVICKEPELYQRDSDHRPMLTFPLAVKRKYFVPEADMTVDVDFPYIKLYGRHAVEHHKTLSRANLILVDGFVNSREIIRKISCDKCETTYKIKELIHEIIPYSIEYIRSNISNTEFNGEDKPYRPQLVGSEADISLKYNSPQEQSDEDVATGRGGAGYDEDIKQILNKMEG